MRGAKPYPLEDIELFFKFFSADFLPPQKKKSFKGPKKI